MGLYIVASLILREFVEVCVPAQVLVELTCAWRFRPEFNNSVCSLSSSEIVQVQSFLLLDISVEFLIGMVTYSVLRWHGLSPFRYLRGLIRTSWPAFLSFAV